MTPAVSAITVLDELTAGPSDQPERLMVAVRCAARPKIRLGPITACDSIDWGTIAIRQAATWQEPWTH